MDALSYPNCLHLYRELLPSLVEIFSLRQVVDWEKALSEVVVMIHHDEAPVGDFREPEVEDENPFSLDFFDAVCR